MCFGEQLSLFDEPQEQLVQGFKQEEIDLCLMSGGCFEYGKLRTFVFYQKCHNLQDCVAFLKDECGTGGMYPTFHKKPGLADVGTDYSPSGVRLWKREEQQRFEIKLSWPDVAKRVRELVDEGKYMVPGDEGYLCLTCAFQKNGRCRHEEYDDCQCEDGSFYVKAWTKCECGREIQFSDIVQSDFGSDFAKCPNCGKCRIFNNKGDRPSAFDLWKAGQLIGE